MDIKYLENVIIPQRKREYEEGKNLGTRQPIYVVLDINNHISEGHSEYISHTTNLKGKLPLMAYADFALDSEDRVIKKSKKGMKNPVEITEFYTDKFVAFFLTSKSAHEYLQYQKHNLSNEAYVYVFYSGYRNIEMDNLLKNT